MLNLIFQRAKAKDPSSVMVDCRNFFSRVKQDSWFEEEFVINLIKEIDGAEVVQGCILRDRFGKVIPADYLSTGSKVMICILKFPEKIFNLTQMGNNVLPFLIKLCAKEDRTVICYRDIPIYELSQIPLQKDYEDYCVNEDSYDDVDEWLEEIMND